MSGTGRQEITVKDIIESDEKGSKDLIRKCKDKRVLKTAKNVAYNKGDHSIVEAIDLRLSKLPYHSM
jgi:hypothetical protein